LATLDKVESKPAGESTEQHWASASRESWSSMNPVVGGGDITPKKPEPHVLDFTGDIYGTGPKIGGGPGDCDIGDKEKKLGADAQPFKSDQINPTGVDQQGLEDCSFMSSVAALASTPGGKEQLTKMMVRNDDGSYTVTFPGDKDHPQTVTQEDLKNPKISKDEQDWAKVMEAAYLKKNPSIENKGIKAKDALQLLTGQNMQGDKIFSGLYSSDTDRIRKSIEADLANGEPVVAGTSKKPKSGALVDNHAYTVTGYNPKTDEVTLRNPWGHNDVKVGETKDGVTVLPNGEVKMSMQTFTENYDRIAYQAAPKSTVQQAGEVISNGAHDFVNTVAGWFD
jgi:Calpain family cysteine protease